MLKALSKAFAQLGDPKVNWVVGLSFVLAVVVLIALWFVLRWLIVGLELFNWGWVNWIIDWLGVVAITGVTLLFFPAVVTMISGMFLEYVVRGVERRHYPDLPAPRNQSYSEIILYLIKFTGLLVLLNLVALPFYFIPVVGVVISWCLNGYLLGREYFELVAQRRLDSAAMREMRRAYPGRIFTAGFVVAVLMTIPLVNLLMPVVATAFFTHIYHEQRQQEARPVPAQA